MEKNSHTGTQSPTPQPFVWMHSGIDKSPERTGQASLPHSLTDYNFFSLETMLHEKTGASVGTPFLLAKLLAGCCLRHKSDDFPIYLKREWNYSQLDSTYLIRLKRLFDCAINFDFWLKFGIFIPFLCVKARMWVFEIVRIQHATKSDTKQSKRKKAIKRSKWRRKEETVSKH